MISLRPHHLVCLRLFAGSGYNEEFARNMGHIFDALRAASDAPFLLAAGADDVCAACPNLCAGGACALGGDVQQRDEAVLHALGLRAGECISHNEVDALLRLHFSPEAFLACCCGCRWHALGYCSHDMLMHRLPPQPG